MKEILWSNAKIGERKLVRRIQKEFNEAKILFSNNKITKLQFDKIKALLLCALNLTENYYTKVYEKEQEMDEQNNGR